MGKKSILFGILFLSLTVILTAQQTGGKQMKISSSAFTVGGMIPNEYTCEGVNMSPPLSWSHPPAGVQSFALIADDPDAPVGTWVHWVVYNIPGTAMKLSENIPAKGKLDDGTLQGKNDFGKIGYGGPCPPGGTHRYFFKLYALDSLLDMKQGATKKELLSAISGHVIGEAQIMGKYSR